MGGAPVVVSSPAKTLSLEGTVIPFSELIQVAPHCINEESLVLFSYGLSPVLVSKADLAEQKLSDVLRNGRGPGEMLLADFVALGYGKDGHVLVLAYDINSAKLNTIDVDASVESGSGVIVKSTGIPFGTFKLFSVNDTLVAKLYKPREATFTYTVLAPDASVLKEYRIYGETNLSHYQMAASADCMKPDGSMVFLGMSYFDKANFLSLKSDNHFTVTTDRKWKKSADSDLFDKVQATGSFEGLENFYVSSHCTDESVFALRYPGNRMYVFDWDGKVLAELILDRKLEAFDCTPDGRFVIGVTEEGELVKYSVQFRYTVC